MRIAARIRHIEAGTLGDWKVVGGEVGELRVHYGPGYRLYFTRRGKVVVVLLCGGDKSSQQRDITQGHQVGLEPRRGPVSKAKNPAKLHPFDAARYLDSDEAVAEYMAAVLETEDPDLLLLALGDVARAKGMAQVAKDAGLGRESLYKALTPGAKPRFDTVMKVARALGVKLTAQSVTSVP